MAKKLPKMEILRPAPALVDEALRSFDQMSRELGGVTERELLAFVGEDTSVEGRKDIGEKEEENSQDDS